jgi:hypothetical protein
VSGGEGREATSSAAPQVASSTSAAAKNDPMDPGKAAFAQAAASQWALCSACGDPESSLLPHPTDGGSFT